MLGMSSLLETMGNCFLFRDVDEETTGVDIKFEDNTKLLQIRDDRIKIKMIRVKIRWNSISRSRR